MTKIPKILFAVKNISFTGNVIKPSRRGVIGSDSTIIRTVLATNPEEAIFLTHPKLYLGYWSKIKFKIYALEVSSRHSIKTPEFLFNHFDHQLAIEHGEFASFANLRMQMVGEVMISKNSLLNKDLLDANGNIYGKHYAIL